MSEARALTNFAGNAVATVVIGRWVGELDKDQAERVLSGDDPFDERTMVDDHGGGLSEPVHDEQRAEDRDPVRV